MRMEMPGSTRRKVATVSVVLAMAIVIFLSTAGLALALTPPPPDATVAAQGSTATTGPAGKIPDVRIPGVSSSDFTDSDVCGECHTEIYKEWQGSMHRNYENPAFTWANAQAAKDTKGLTKDLCVACHTPIGAISGETKGGETGLSALAKKGVSCDFCHVIDKVNPDWPGNASFHVAPGLVKRAQLKDAISPKHKTAYSKLHTEADFCGMCHNLSHPLSGVTLEQTYTEWKKSDYAKKGVTCQECHMPPKKGRAAKQGPVRPKRYTHSFVGANYRFANEKLAVEDLRKAAKLDMTLSQKEATAGSPLRVTIKVMNVGAGHYLPTGLAELREMWLEVVAKDKAGNELFRDKREYGTVLEDATGRHDKTVPVWKAVKVYRDTRVPPNGSLEENFDFDLKTQAVGYVTVDARLWYRSLPVSFTKAAGLAEAKPVEMTRAADRVTMTVPWWSRLFGGAIGGAIWIPEVLAVIVGVLLLAMIVVAVRGRMKKGRA
ncbi:MAG: hypothetical protein C4521_12310 [Actinobacteria bacterium]|nr:MAG: hypothetical protein C4521_12310 [Actinomycetota bacterium]